MKLQIKDAEIHFLTKAKYQPILSANPYIDKLHLLHNSMNALTEELRSENFDYIIDLHKNIRTYRIKLLLRRISFSFNKLNYRKWLLVNFRKNKLPDTHIVDRYMKTADVFSVANDHKGLDYFVPEDTMDTAPKLTGELPGSYIVVVVGGGHNTKQIPPDKINAMIDRLTCNIVLLGGPEDVQKAKQIEHSDKKNVFDLVGKLTVNQSAFIIKKSLLIVTPDTGLMHIAAAFKKKIISVWGNTVPEFGMYPYLPHKNSRLFEVNGLSCRPCSKIGFSKCPKKHFNCMKQQDYQEIVSTIERFIGK
jgi:ADP-heptose:LPS heptosyltransferase